MTQPFATLVILQQGGGTLFPFLLQIGAIFAIFYFLLIRPQQKQRKQHEETIRKIKKGDEIVTTGGLVGEVVHIREQLVEGQPKTTMEDRVTIKSGDSKLIIERGRIAKVFLPKGA
jgi:preprotein translocase subunit YajC